MFIAVAFSVTVYAQTDSLTAKDYARAESFLFYKTQQYIDHGSILYRETLIL